MFIKGRLYCKITTSRLVLNFTAHKGNEISVDFPALCSFIGNPILGLVSNTYGLSAGGMNDRTEQHIKVWTRYCASEYICKMLIQITLSNSEFSKVKICNKSGSK